MSFLIVHVCGHTSIVYPLVFIAFKETSIRYPTLISSLILAGTRAQFAHMSVTVAPRTPAWPAYMQVEKGKDLG